MASDPYSVMPAQSDMLGRIIEYTGNVIIGSGGFDMLVPTNGTLLVLQNVTWAGKQGFEKRPDDVVGSPTAILNEGTDKSVVLLALLRLAKPGCAIHGRRSRHVG